MAGEPKVVDELVRRFCQKFQFGTIVHGPERLRYFGFNEMLLKLFLSHILEDVKWKADRYRKAHICVFKQLFWMALLHSVSILWCRIERTPAMYAR